MGKKTGTKATLLATAAKVRVPEVIVQAGLTPEQAARFVHTVATVPNPLGEVTVQGDIRRHKACRRVPQFETLYRSRVIDDAAFIVLGWYAGRLGLGVAGLFKSCLDMTGRTVVHAPSRVDARDDLDWARAHILPGLLPVFDGVMHDDESFAAIARRLFPDLSEDWGKRRASGEFKAAVTMLSTGIGHLIKLGNVA